MEPKGTIVFTTVGRPEYGFDIFSLALPSILPSSPTSHLDHILEHRLTDGISVNYNGSFAAAANNDAPTLVYVSERSGSSRIYLNRGGGTTHPEVLPSATASLFHDSPIIDGNARRLYFISAHEPPEVPFKSWSALYSVTLDSSKGSNIPSRLTPYGCVDYSPALSQSGKLIAVASYGSRPWPGEFNDLQTDVVVFPEADPTNRTVVCQHGGWPTWSGDSTIYFHRQADDGWWSIFRIDLPENFEHSGSLLLAPRRVTPPGLHSFTPAAAHDNPELIAVATRRRDKCYRHIEMFDVKCQKFYPLTELLNPNFHHYNPFLSPQGGFLGYHRFRGESAPGQTIIPHLDPVTSPIDGLRMLRLNGSFPTFSPAGDYIAFNHDFDSKSGIKIVKSDGSKRWTLLKDQTAFYNSWSPTEKHVIFTSIGPIFQAVTSTVQIARISFDPSDLVDDRDEVAVDVKILTREDTGNNAFPSCSPDGKFLVFRSGRTGHKNLYILDAVEGECNNSGSIRQLTKGPWIDTMPSWSPDGKLIAFSSNRHNPDDVGAFSIYVIRPDGSDLRRIHVAGPAGSEAVDRERVNHVCFMSDDDCDQWLLFTANLGGVTAEPVSLPNQFQPYGDLHVVKLDGSGLRRLTWNGYENGTPAWHSGGDDIELERMSSLCLNSSDDQGSNGNGNGNGDKLKGQFEEPLWLHTGF